MAPRTSTWSFLVLLGVVLVVGVLLQNPRIVDVVHAHRAAFFLALGVLALYAAVRGFMTGGYRTGEFGFGDAVSRRQDPFAFYLALALGLFIAAVFFWMYLHHGDVV
jgi:hypothetical protein